MTLIIGIVGSPRKDELTSQLVDAALEGAKGRNVEVKKVYLIDFDVQPYGVRESCPKELNRLCEEADGIILGSPVYWGDVSGLTKSFMETVSISSYNKSSNSNGTPTLGISIAGGTGKGLISGIQTIYRFFWHKRMRGIDPTPVSRFNFDEAIKALHTSGRKLATLSKDKLPFRDLTEVSQYYQSLPYLNCDILDTYMLLVTQLLKIANSDQIRYATKEYEKAMSLIQSKDRIEAVKHAVNAYEALYY